MARRILVVPTTHAAGVTAACLGLAHALDSRRVAVGFAKPFAQARLSGEDSSTELVRLTTSLRPPQPIPADTLASGLAGENILDVMQQVVGGTAEVAASSRVLVLEGLASGAGQLHAERINVEVAQALDAQVLLVGSATGLDPDQLAEQMSATERLYRVRGEQRVVGAVVNRLPADADPQPYRAALEARGIRAVAFVHARPDLSYRRVGDLVRELDLGVLSGSDLSRRVGSIAIAAQSVPGCLDSFVPDRLMLVPGDRHDVLMATALTETGGTHLAAVLLTAGVEPDPQVLELMRPATESGLTILTTPHRTFETATRLNALDAEIPGDDEERARAVMTTFSAAYDEDWLDELPHDDRPERLTPARFAHESAVRTSTGTTRIAFSDAIDPRVLAAVSHLESHDRLRPILVGNPTQVEDAARWAGVTLPTGIDIVDPAVADERYGASIRAARERAGDFGLADADPLVCALAMQDAGDVDGVVGGIDLDRYVAMRTIAAFVDRRSDVHTVSASQFVVLPDEVVLYADPVLNTEPDAMELACIAAQTAATAEDAGLTPRIAFIAPTSSAPHAPEQRERIEQARAMLAERRPDLHTCGPVPLRQAVVRAPHSTGGAENATVFVFPEIASAAASVKVAAGSVGVHVLPPLLQGLTRAVNTLPRDASVRQISQVALGTAQQAGLRG